MILIDGTYFTGELSLPNIPSTSHVDVQDGVSLALQTVGENNLEHFIDKYVIDYLIRLLGRELAVTFIEEIETVSPEQIWLDLKDHLITEFRSYKSSPLANYTYCMVSRDAVTRTMTGGEADPEFDFAKNASNELKIEKAWSDMADMTMPVVEWLCEKDTVRELEAYSKSCSGKDIRSITRKINQFGI